MTQAKDSHPNTKYKPIGGKFGPWLGTLLCVHALFQAWLKIETGSPWQLLWFCHVGLAIACVASADLPRLARLRPGAAVRFAVVTPEDAEALRRRQEQDFARLNSSIKPLLDEAASLAQALQRENLISGGEWVVDENWPQAGASSSG